MRGTAAILLDVRTDAGGKDGFFVTIFVTLSEWQLSKVTAESEIAMTNNLKSQQRTLKWGDAAVDGLLVGEVAGAGMLAYVAVAGLMGGLGLTTTLGLFDPGGSGSALAGVLSHLAVSGVYGAIFGLGSRVLKRWVSHLSVGLAGIIYGLILLTLALSILLPTARSPLLTISPLHFAIAHGLYGLTLGVGLGRRHPTDR